MSLKLLKKKLTIEELPSLSKIAKQIMTLVMQDDVSLDKLAAAIKKDPKLSTKIIQVVNTPIYAPQNIIADISQAVSTLGLKRVKNMALSLTIMSSLEHTVNQATYDNLVNCSLGAAVLSETLALQQKNSYLQDSFFCGLVQYLGRFVLAGALGDRYHTLLQEAESQSLRFDKVLEDNLKIHAHEVGLRLAQKWNLPKIACCSLSYGDDPEKAIAEKLDQDFIRLIKIIHISTLITEVFFSTGKMLNIENFKQTYALYYDKSVKHAEKELIKLGKVLSIFLKSVNQKSSIKISYTRVLSIANAELSQVNKRYEQMYFDLSKSNQELEKLNAELNKKNKVLAKIAAYDFLTGIHNRREFEKTLECFILMAERHQEKLAVLLLDLDNFKIINDIYGQDMGDLLLSKVATLLSNHLRQHEFVARLEGDAFAIILPKLENEQQAGHAAERICNLLSQPLLINHTNLSITGSIGIACYPKAGMTLDALIKSADVALNSAKVNGKNTFKFFTDALSKLCSRRMELDHAFTHAIKDHEFSLVFQPILFLKNKKLFGFECLSRWNSHELGVVNPNEFIPYAESYGKMAILGKWVIFHAIKKIYEFYQIDKRQLVYAINISPCQLFEENFVYFIETLLSKYQLPASMLVLELSELGVMDNIELATTILKKLSDLGIKVNIDDFGTGHSSLLKLKKIPFNALKIDNSFIKDMFADKNSLIIVDTILSLSKNLGLETVAEGIESEQQLFYLLNHGCAYGQGYYFAKPLTSEDVPRYLTEHQ